MCRLQKQVDEQHRMVQRLGEHMDGNYDKMYQDVEHEHGWVYQQFKGVKVTMENNHASLGWKNDRLVGETIRIVWWERWKNSREH